MRRLTTGLLFCLAALAASACSAQAERRVALVVGNSEYKNVTKLANPANDANAVAAMFKSAGFDVVDARLDLNNVELKRAVRDFTAAARDADIAVMYFAGHGIEVGGINYLIPVDAELVSDFDAEDEALSLDRAVRAMDSAKKLRLIILDACRDNPFAKTMKRTIASRSFGRGLARIEPEKRDTLIAFAAEAGSTADDGGGNNSPFTAALVSHLASPGLDIRLALGRVRDDVRKATGSKQEPFVYGSLGGATVALVPDKSDVAAPVAAAKPGFTADPGRDYEFAERLGTAEGWDLFLTIHKTGFYADLARAHRAKLAGLGGNTPKAAEQTREISVAPVPPSANAPRVSLLPPPGEAASTSELLRPAPDLPKPAPVPVVPPVAALSPDLPAKSEQPPQPDIRKVTLQLQTELKRVGCDPGNPDGNWTPKSRGALDQFNRRAGTKLDVKVASLGALDIVKARTGRICPLVCGDGERLNRGVCVAIPQKPQRREASRPPERAAPRERERVRESVRERPAARAASCGPGGSPFFQGSLRCCEYTPERGAPRIVCP